jgi:lipoyl(octanoyl) transferase
MLKCQLQQPGRVEYARAFEWQQRLVADRKSGAIPDQLILLEHPHTITLGRNGHLHNLLASEEILTRAGIAFHPTDRGGDITYHGPGQIVGYPILDLREWQRDVGAYVRAIEQTLIDTLADFGIQAGRIPKCTGVWVGDAKIAAIGVHISRWVTSHGFALNVSTGLSYFQYIVPCGLTKPVTSMAQLGSDAPCAEVAERLATRFGRVFEREIERIAHDGRSDAPDGREYRGRDADQVAEESRRPRGAGRTAVRDLDRQSGYGDSVPGRGDAIGSPG